jgi:hypothetical protein
MQAQSPEAWRAFMDAAKITVANSVAHGVCREAAAKRPCSSAPRQRPQAPEPSALRSPFTAVHASGNDGMLRSEDFEYRRLQGGEIEFTSPG